MCIDDQGTRPKVYSYTNHPFVLQVIQGAVKSDPAFCYAGSISRNTIAIKRRGGVLVLDTCSIDDWRHVIDQWQTFGGRCLLLASPDFSEPEHRFGMLKWGVHGIVLLSARLGDDLRNALACVIAGRLWCSQAELSQYVERTMGPVLPPDALRYLTSREQQILKLILNGLSNREIGRVLGISERTVKFHVGNILNKCRAANRKSLLALSQCEHSSGTSPSLEKPDCEE